MDHHPVPGRGPRRARPLRTVLPAVAAAGALALVGAVLPASPAAASPMAAPAAAAAAPRTGLIDDFGDLIGGLFGDAPPDPAPPSTPGPGAGSSPSPGATASAAPSPGPTASGPTAAATTGAVRADDGATVSARTRVDARTLDLTITSPALHGTGKVRLLLPAGWTPTAARTWPSLYLLHGANEPADYTSWTTFTDAQSFLAGKDVLGVLPTDGGAGFYSASWDYGRHRGPDWETFHTVELPQLLSRGFRASDVRAVAGLSIGGLGAIDYAARHPGLFRAAASYSGMLDTLLPGVPAYVDTIKLREGQDPVALWGSPVLQRGIWKRHNPADLVSGLKGVRVFVSAGDGSGGELDRGATVDFIEPMAWLCAQSFVDRMHGAGLPVTVDLYGGGTHTWPYWERELHTSWPVLAAGLGVSP